MNIKEICKVIKQDGKHTMIWRREEGRDFISNRHFLMKFDNLPKEILAALFGIFYQIPEVGTTMTVYRGQEPIVKNDIDFSKIYQPEKQDVICEVTPYLREFDRYDLRVIKKGTQYCMIQDRYYYMVTKGSEIVSSDDGAASIIYFRHKLGDLLILPVRTGEDYAKNIPDMEAQLA